MEMDKKTAKVVATAPAFCESALLRAELSRLFPNSEFNDKGCYLPESELIEFLKNADAAVVGRDPINEKVLTALPRLKIIAKYGVGLDNVDREALRRHHVALGWTPGVNRLSVAELTLCFMIGLYHKAFSGGDLLKRQIWRKDGGRQLTGKTVGIVGCGHVGAEVIRLLAPFNCRILVRDILDKSEFSRTHGAEEVGFEDLIRRSDIVSLHVPLTEQTQNMIDEKVLSRMKSSAFLINTSRGEVVDQPALKKALQKETLAGAALDVFAEEPPRDAEFLACPNLMVTPHIGGNAVEAVEAMGLAAITHLVEFFRNEND